MKNKNQAMMDEQNKFIETMTYNLRYNKKSDLRFTLKLKSWEVTK